MAEERLYCEIGDHVWIADLKPGETKPKACAFHAKQSQPAKPAKPKSKSKSVPIPAPEKSEQTLYCEAGEHQWTRAPQRGKKPKNCPEHQPQPQKAAEGSSRAPRASGEGRPNFLSLAEIRERYPRIDPETAMVFAYYEREVNAPHWPGGREPADVDLLVKGYKMRLEGLARAHSRKSTQW